MKILSRKKMLGKPTCKQVEVSTRTVVEAQGYSMLALKMADPGLSPKTSGKEKKQGKVT